MQKIGTAISAHYTIKRWKPTYNLSKEMQSLETDLSGLGQVGALHIAPQCHVCPKSTSCFVCSKAEPSAKRFFVLVKGNTMFENPFPVMLALLLTVPHAKGRWNRSGRPDKRWPVSVS